jgi:hypothetical protein
MHEGAENYSLLLKNHPDPGGRDRKHHDLLGRAADRHALDASGPQERPYSSYGTRNADKNAAERLMLDNPFRDSDVACRSDSQNESDAASVGDEKCEI